MAKDMDKKRKCTASVSHALDNQKRIRKRAAMRPFEKRDGKI